MTPYEQGYYITMKTAGLADRARNAWNAPRLRQEGIDAMSAVTADLATRKAEYSYLAEARRAAAQAYHSSPDQSEELRQAYQAAKKTLMDAPRPRIDHDAETAAINLGTAARQAMNDRHMGMAAGVAAPIGAYGLYRGLRDDDV
jgi:hypothetical protein